MRTTLIAILAVVCAILTAADGAPAVAGTINLAAMRGVRTSASPEMADDQPASLPLHRIEGEIRFHSHFGTCWWMMELPRPCRVSGLRIACRDVITSVGFTVRVAEAAPAQWASVPVVASFTGPLADGEAVVGFPAATVRYIRIDIAGHNGGERGRGSGHADFVLSMVQVWGPDNAAAGPDVSIAQSGWAGGSCTLHDATVDEYHDDGRITVRPPRDCPELVDDNDPAAPRHGVQIVTFRARGSGAGDPATPPADVVVTLARRSRVTVAAYAALAADRSERPRDLRLWTSPSALGDDWVLQAERQDIAGGPYVEIPLPAPTVAKRVRFEIRRVWNQHTDPRRGAEGHLAEVYVFGEPMPPDFTIAVPEAGQVSCQIIDREGRAVRSFMAVPRPAGDLAMEWDGLNDDGVAQPPGAYHWRAVVNRARYLTMGGIGNSALPATANMNPTTVASLAVDGDGDVYSANVWEEAAQDFRRWTASDGRHVYDARAAIRNGDPNALPYAIAVDADYLYCATSSHTTNAQQHIRRFRRSDGAPAPFPAGGKAGHILVHEWPERAIPPGTPPGDADLMRQPLRALAVSRGHLYVADALAGRILVLEAATGRQTGSIAIDLPQALAIDDRGQLWVGHGHGAISVIGPDGQLTPAIHGLGRICAMSCGPGDRLYVADADAHLIRVFHLDPQRHAASAERNIGQPAQLGDWAPDRFYRLSALDADPRGGLVVAQQLTREGARVTSFAPDGSVRWDHLGAEFCDNGTYAHGDPDEFVSQFFHRYRLDRRTGAWSFRGCVLDGDPRYLTWPHGCMRRLVLGGHELLFQGFGSGLQVYRRDGAVYRLAAMFGAGNPMPDGTFWDLLPETERRQRPVGMWSWHDVDGDGKVSDAEITWARPPEPGWGFACFGVNVDQAGNAMYCDYTNEITEVPLAGLDARGNPIYDLAHRRVLVPRDPGDKPILCDPIMAVRSDDGSIYVHSRSKVYLPPAESAGGWMAGWMLAKYDRDGKRLWYRRLPTACPGMDAIPGGGGVMLVSIKWGREGCPVYHYDADGLLVGVMTVAPAFRGSGGIPDNTASLVVARDPRDGILDVFIEDCLGNRIRWQRVDDRPQPLVVSGVVNLDPARMK